MIFEQFMVIMWQKVFEPFYNFFSRTLKIAKDSSARYWQKKKKKQASKKVLWIIKKSSSKRKTKNENMFIKERYKSLSEKASTMDKI